MVLEKMMLERILSSESRRDAEPISEGFRDTHERMTQGGGLGDFSMDAEEPRVQG